MSTTLQYVIIGSLGLVVFILATYLGFLTRKVQLRKASDEKRRAELIEEYNQTIKETKDSMIIIARAMNQGQCEISEGVIRIKKLSDKLLEYKDTEVIRFFGHMYEKFEDFAFLDARKKLSKQEIFNQDKKRFKIENDHEDAVKKACLELISQLESSN